MNTSNGLFDDSLIKLHFARRRSKTKKRVKTAALIKCRNIGLSKKHPSSKIDVSSKQIVNTSSNSIKNESSVITTQQLNKLESWGLPPSILAKYEERGVKEMFKWQVECLSNVKILNDHANLVYSAPTSAGKTLVAEILAIKTVLERQRKVLIILPFVSVVREKMFYFQDIFSTSGVRVEGFMGSYNPPGGFKTVQVAVCTIEKANNIVNRLLEEGQVGDIGAVVIDELHLLGDPSRGYLLELLLTKLLYISKKHPDFKIQLIGMSATLPNLSVLSTWLSAELFKTDFRPIPLVEQCYANGTLCDANFEIIRKIDPHPDIPKDMDNIIQFCLETIYCSCSVLIFCSAKNWCETLAQQISNTFRLLGRSESPLGTCLREQLKTELIVEVLEQLKRCPVGLDAILKTTVSFGVAYHHAGLTIDERDIIEGAFRSGALRVLVATSTLSAGVNLPARRVIIRSPMFAGKPMDTLVYRQMIGRAGRMGKDTAGESILICQRNEKYAAEQLLSGKLKPIRSCLEGTGRLKRAILEVIASGVAISPADIKLFTNCTLLASSDDMDDLENPIEDTVHFLLRNQFIRLQKTAENDVQYVATSLAKACLSSAIPPEEGLTLLAELEKARQCFVLESELHIIYLVTPYSACNQWGTIDWMFFHSLWESLSEADRRVGDLIGIRESFIARAMSGRTSSNSQHQLHIHRRFFVALALRELVEEVPLAMVADKYKCNRGLLQSLQQSASTFAGMVTAFSKQLGWSTVELLVAQFQDRLQFGVNRELLDLMRMPSLNGCCARFLFNGGIDSIVTLAATDVCTLENILTRAVPFESEKGRDGETAFEAEKRKKIKTIWISGKNGLTEREAAEMLIIEARNFLKYEMGIAEAKWDTEVETEKQEKKMEADENKTGLDTSSKLYVTLNSVSQAKSMQSSIENSRIVELNKELNSSPPQTYIVESNNVPKCSPTKTIIEPENMSEASLELSKQKIDDENSKVIDTFSNLNNTDIFEAESIPLIDVSAIFKQSMDEKSQDVNNIKIFDVESMPLIDASIKNQQEIDLLANETALFESESLPNADMDVLESDTLNLERSKQKNEAKCPEPPSPKQINICVDDMFESGTPSIFNKVQICGDEFIKASDYLTIENNLKSNMELNISVNLKTSKSYNWSTMDGQFSDMENKLIMEADKSVNKTLNQSGSLFEESMMIDSNICHILDKKYDCTEPLGRLNRSTKNSTPVLSEANTFLDQAFDSFSLPDEKNTPVREKSHENSRRQSLRKDSEDDDIVLNSNDDSIDTPIRSKLHEITKRKLLLRSTKIEKSSLKNNKRAQKTISPITPKKDRIETIRTRRIRACTFEKIEIIDVCKNKKLFETTTKKLLAKNELSISVACEKFVNTKSEIGNRILRYHGSSKKIPKVQKFVVKDTQIIGVSIYGENNIVYYFSLEQEDTHVLDFLQRLFMREALTIYQFDAKEQIKLLLQLKFNVKCKFFDPKIIEWLFDPEFRGKSLHTLVKDYNPELKELAKSAGKSMYQNSIALNINSPVSGKLRSATESLLTWFIIESQQNKIAEQNWNLTKILHIEMATILCLAHMEVCGFGVNREQLDLTLSLVQDKMADIETECYSIVGRHFSLSSSTEVAKVLKLTKTRKAVSTNKQVLEKLDNPIAALVILWRKLNSILTKTLFPVLREVDESRIYCCSDTFNATGRITMREPSLQSIPRDFDIAADSMQVLSVRKAFVPRDGYSLISADYCQLELRLLAHLSQDRRLCAIMHSDQDVFRLIAAKWNKISVSEVDDVMRQHAKQLCYGIIYGMGSKTLGDHLEIDEQQAKSFIESFKNTYPKIRDFIQRTIENCRKHGYVETLHGRRRYFENIHKSNALKSQAERQAVNTTIQGSAADIAKTAMVHIDQILRSHGHRANLVLHLHDELIYEAHASETTAVMCIIKSCMEQAVSLSIPFPVKVKCGPSWGELEVIDHVMEHSR